jgi:hypothetical protein
LQPLKHKRPALLPPGCHLALHDDPADVSQVIPLLSGVNVQLDCLNVAGAIKAEDKL